jgi:hypothetical protein
MVIRLFCLGIKEQVQRERLWWMDGGMDDGAIKIEDFEILLPPMFFLDAKACA